jgi:hypothetical protein
MSVRHMGLVLDHYDGPPALKLALLVLADHANTDGICWPSYGTVAKRLCCTERTAMRNVAALVKEGLVEVLERGGRGRDRAGEAQYFTNVFKVNEGALRRLPSLCAGVTPVSPLDMQPVESGPSPAETRVQEGDEDTRVSAVTPLIQPVDKPVAGVTDMTPVKPVDEPTSGVTPVTSRGDIHDSPLSTAGVTPVSPKPSLEPSGRTVRAVGSVETPSSHRVRAVVRGELARLRSIAIR